jgi:putative acetyltransferase
MNTPSIVQATSAADIGIARDLFREYQLDIGIDLCFQNFNEELATLPGAYAPPEGRLFICFVGEIPGGCVALRKIDERTCEMKRMFVRSELRGHHIGRLLAERVIQDARTIGYQTMRLDTLPAMKEAIALYRSLGFVPTEAYRLNPHPGALYMERPLSPLSV